MNKKNESKIGKIIIIGAVVIAVITIVSAIVIVMTGKGREIKKYLDLGQKYIQEMNYEEAVASFEKVLNIDPMNEEAYVGMADAYIGMGDPTAAKDVLEKGIKILSDAGKDASVLENKLAEVEELIETQAKVEAEQTEIENAEANEMQENDYPNISIEPIISALSSVWGRNWLDWTLEDFIAEYNLLKVENSPNEQWEKPDLWDNAPTFSNRAFIIGDQRSICTTSLFITPDGNNRGYDCKHLYSMQGYTSFSQDIWAEQADVIQDDLCAFALSNGINSLNDVPGYFGLEMNDIRDTNDPVYVNTEYGTAIIGYSKLEYDGRIDESISISQIEGLEGMSIGFHEYSAIDPCFVFTANQY